MARLFPTGPGRYLESTAAPVTALPVTMACWFRAENIADNHCLLSLGDGVESRLTIIANGAVVGDPLRVQAVNSAGTVRTADTTTGFSRDIWHHVCGVWESTTARRVYLDGGSKGENSLASTLSTPNRLTVAGRWAASNLGQFADAQIAEIGVWNIALTDTEVSILATRRVRPTDVQPSYLVAYYPLLALDETFDWNMSPMAQMPHSDLRIFGALPTQHPPGFVLPVKHMAYRVFVAGGQQFQLNLGGSISPSGAMAMSAIKILNGGATPVGLHTLSVSKILTGTIAPAGTLTTTKLVIQSLSGAISPVGDVMKSTTKLLTGVVTPVGVVVKLVLQSLSGAFSPTGTLMTTKLVLQSLSGSISPIGALVRLVTKVLNGVISPIGTLTKFTTKILGGDITPSGALTSTKLVLQSLAGTISPIGVLVRTTIKNLGGAIAPTGALHTTQSRIFTGAITPVGILVRSTTKIVSGLITPIGTLTTTVSAVFRDYDWIEFTLKMRRSLALTLPIRKALSNIQRIQKVFEKRVER